MSEQVLERGIDRTPDTLTELEIEEPRVDLGAPFSSVREVGGVAVLRVMETKETPEEVLQREFGEVVAQARNVAANLDATYLSPQWVEYTHDTLLPNLTPERRVTINYGASMLTGRLRDHPTITTAERSPVQIKITLVDEETGELRETTVTPGQITILSDQLAA